MTDALLKLPNPLEIAQLLADTLGREVEAGDGPPCDVAGSMSAFYLNEAGTEGIVCICDVPLVNYTGAALALIPVSIAQDGAKRHELPDAMIENFFEILNILGAVLNQVCPEHVRLVDVKYPGDPLPEPVAALIRGCERRHDLLVDIEDYGKGSMTLLHLP